jgi:hypothetical protein
MDCDFLSHFLLLVVLHHQFLRNDLAGEQAVRWAVLDLVAFGKTALEVEKDRVEKGRRKKSATKRNAKKKFVNLKKIFLGISVGLWIERFSVGI